MRFVFEQELGLDFQQIELLVVDQLSFHPDFRAHFIEALFENLRAKSVNFIHSALSGFLLSGFTTGIAVEMRNLGSNIGVIYEGYMLRYS